MAQIVGAQLPLPGLLSQTLKGKLSKETQETTDREIAIPYLTIY